MTTKTAILTSKPVAALLPRRDEVETYEDRATDHLEQWLKANAPDILALWLAHLDLVMYRTMPENDTPEFEEIHAREAALSVETVLRVTGPLPQPKPADALRMQLVSTWKHLTAEEKAGIVAVVGIKVDPSAIVVEA